MGLTLFFIVTGSALLSLLIALQVKYIPPEVGAVARYNLLVLPLLYLANVSLGAGFTRAHGAVKNLPLLAAGQSFAYYLFLLLFAVFLLGDRVSLPRVLAGFALMAAGIYLLRS